MIWLSIIGIGILAILLIGKLTKYWLILMGIFLTIIAGIYFYISHRNGIQHPVETVTTFLNHKKA